MHQWTGMQWLARRATPGAFVIGLVATACLPYEQATPHKESSRAGGGQHLCGSTELEHRARRALARTEREDPRSIEVGEILLDIATICRKAGAENEARAFLERARFVLAAKLAPGDTRLTEIERQRRLLGPSPGSISGERREAGQK